MGQSETEVLAEQQEQVQSMDKNSLLKELATNGYDVGFVAKKNFAHMKLFQSSQQNLWRFLYE
ncbi:hypothetical protein ACQKII_23820 [Lysinibacillus sp. NPDC048646]|uniref:hypothetical protein n=1 Tax=unclassified Lysinibacillus TaxID=2636778 RepID=UPI00381D41CC